MTIKHQFKLNGQDYELTDDEIRLATQKAERVEEIRKTWVKIGHRKFPVKQALHLVLPGLMRSGFTTQDAIRILRRFDFEMGEG